MSTLKKTYNEKIIIAGFPGVGKSKAAELLPGIVHDLESSDFHWITHKNDNQVIADKHPAWPANYIEAVKALSLETVDLHQYKDLLYICVSTHEQTLKLIKDAGLKFIITIPGEDKDDMVQRYKDRGNNPEFIKKLDENYDQWIKDLEQYNMPILKLPKGKYLFDILNEPENYNYLKGTLKCIGKSTITYIEI